MVGQGGTVSFLWPLGEGSYCWWTLRNGLIHSDHVIAMEAIAVRQFHIALKWQRTLLKLLLGVSKARRL